MKIALYKHLEYGGSDPHVADDWAESSEEYLRLTNIVDVDFVEVSKDETVPKEIDYLRNEIKKADALHGIAIEKIETKISKLLAITHEVEG